MKAPSPRCTGTGSESGTARSAIGGGILHEIGKDYNILNIIEIELVFGVNPSLDIFDLRLMSRNVVKCQRSIIGPSDQRGNEETQLFDTYHGYFYKTHI